jgi:threonine aldolase
MRRAMAEAEVGDDVFHDDPTVARLEEETAALLGKEAAVFVPSGCMGNECAFAALTREGDSILLERHSHPVLVEARAVTELLRRRFHVLDGDRGRLSAEQIAAAIPGVPGGTRIALLEVENTFNWGSGSIYRLPQLQAIARLARELGIPVHLDGARLWNATAATGVALSDYAATADSVMVCYSKGLGAPLGSAVAGTAAFVADAREARRAFGGGMRQVGIVAAGALHALRNHRDRLAEDHARARRLAEALAAVPGLEIDPEEVETNIVIAGVSPADRLPGFVEALRERGVLTVPFGGPGRFRAVTHLDVDDGGIARAAEAAREAAREVLAA